MEGRIAQLTYSQVVRMLSKAKNGWIPVSPAFQEIAKILLMWIIMVQPDEAWKHDSMISEERIRKLVEEIYSVVSTQEPPISLSGVKRRELAVNMEKLEFNPKLSQAEVFEILTTMFITTHRELCRLGVRPEARLREPMIRQYA